MTLNLHTRLILILCLLPPAALQRRYDVGLLLLLN